MNICDTFEQWVNNPTPRTQANLLRAMRNMGDMLDNAGISPHWHENLQVNCHDEVVEILEMLGGARGLIAA